VALAEPEADDGADEDDWIPDDELPVPEDELLAPDPPGVAREDDPAMDVADLGVDAPAAAACPEPGRVKASPPATASPSTPAPAVVARSRRRARSRCTRADTVRGSLLFIMSPSRKLAPLLFRNDLWLSFPVHLRRL
jgi:hypothetical protein